MARSAGGDGKSSEAEATTLHFATKTAWEELEQVKRQTSKRSKSANGTYGKTLTRLVKDEHMDRKAAGIVLALAEIEDDSDLHVTVHHVLDGMAKLGVLRRAMVSDALELFDEHKVGPAVRRAREAAGAKKPDRKANGAAAPADGAAAMNGKPFPAPDGAASE